MIAASVVPFYQPILALAVAMLAWTSVATLFKSLLSKAMRPAPPAGLTLGLTVVEPFLYVVSVYGALNVAEDIWLSEELMPAYGALGMTIAFVTIAGLHGWLLGRSNRDIPEGRRLGLSIIYAFAIPITILALAATAAFVLTTA